MINSMLFSSVADVLYGAHTSDQLGDIAAKMGITRALIVTDPGIIKFKLLDGALKNLETNGVKVNVYSDVVADPPESVVMAAVSAAQTFGCDGVIGFGGGSSMDVAKLLAVLIKGEQQLSEMYGVDQVRGGRLPLIQVPTTAGTGSEATMVSIITTGATTKAGVVSRTLLADKIILDATLTLGLPPATRLPQRSAASRPVSTSASAQAPCTLPCPRATPEPPDHRRRCRRCPACAALDSSAAQEGPTLAARRRSSARRQLVMRPPLRNPIR